MGILILLGALLLPAGLQAQNNKNRKRVVPLTKKGAASELPTVKRVGNGMITVGGKRYVVSSSARITVNGEEAELDDIRPGMQVSVSGGVSKYGKTEADTLYKATRISARADNQLEKKRKEFNKKQAERARRLNRNNNRRRR